MDKRALDSESEYRERELERLRAIRAQRKASLIAFAKLTEEMEAEKK